MTVVEYEDRIVVVDCGLRFPTAEMMGIDLVLPDFTYLRENIDKLQAIVITHGHEDHIGALPFVMRALGADKPPVYGGPLTMAMARSKLDEHRLKDTDLTDVRPGETLELGPFDIELIGLRAGGLRLPLIEASDDEKTEIRAVLDRHGLLSGAAS